MCNCDLPKYKDEFIQEHALEFFSSSDLEIIVKGGWGKGQWNIACNFTLQIYP